MGHVYVVYVEQWTTQEALLKSLGGKLLQGNWKYVEVCCENLR